MVTEKTDSNYFGQFLRALRLSRGFTNINEYLRRYPLSISTVHYRYLESGSRKVGVDAAQELCTELQADAKSFYHNLLKDWLPEGFMAFFVGLSDDEQSAQAREVYQKAVMRVLDAQTLYPSRACCEYLSNHFELMPIVWFFYSVFEASLEQITAVAKANGIAISVDQIVDDFEQFGLIKVDAQRQVVQRVKPTISFSHDELGKKLLLHETQRRLNYYVKAGNEASKDTVVVLSMMCVSAKARQTIYRRIQDFLRDAAEGAKSSFEDRSQDSEPVYYSIIFAPRPQYRVASYASDEELI
jgi:transcriptional regulator with XRE-family HTH domain